MSAILAAGLGGYSIVYLIKIAIIVAACVAILLVACRAMGVAIPQWVIQMLVIVAVAACAIIALSFLVSL